MAELVDRAQKAEIRRLSATGSEGLRILDLSKWELNCSGPQSGCQLGEDRVVLSSWRSMLILRLNAHGSLVLEKERDSAPTFSTTSQSANYEGPVVLCDTNACELHRCSDDGSNWRRERLPRMKTRRMAFASSSSVTTLRHRGTRRKESCKHRDAQSDGASILANPACPTTHSNIRIEGSLPQRTNHHCRRVEW